jgi:hypothetical protein
MRTPQLSFSPFLTTNHKEQFAMAQLKKRNPYTMADPLADEGREEPLPPRAAGTPVLGPAGTPAIGPVDTPAPLPVQRLVRVNFDVPQDLHTRIRMKAFSEGRSLKDIARELLQRWVNE